jgi:hypothetical protein
VSRHGHDCTNRYNRWLVPSSTVTPEIIDTIDELGLDNRSVQAFSSEAYEGLAADDEEFEIDLSRLGDG